MFRFLSRIPHPFFPSLRFVAGMLVLTAFLALGVQEAGATRFYQKNSTWYTKIPANPTITANSANYINDILYNNPSFALNYGEWSVPVFYATASTPYITVPVNNSNTTQKNYIIQQQWNVVPIPSGALPAGNASACAGGYTDGHMVVINADRTASYEFFGAKYCNGTWSTWVARKWDLTGDGILVPYDLHGSLRLTSVPLTHGLLMYDEVANNTIDHALEFAYNADKYFASGYQTIYPSGSYVQGSSTRAWALLAGMRVQLDPAVDCNALNLTAGGKNICRALQTYGMIFVENSGVGDNSIYAEKNKNWSALVGSISAIPINRMRVVDPIYPSATGDTTAPAAPTGLAGSAASASQAALSWTASTDNVGVAGYRIYRNGAQVGTSTSVSYTDSGLAASTAYSYQVAAYDAAGNVSAKSASVSVTTPASTATDTAAPSVPAGLSAIAASSSQVNLSWTASTDNVRVSGYKIYRGGSQVGTSASTSYSSTGLAAGTAYTFTVAAYDASGNTSSQSGPVSVTTQSGAGGTAGPAPIIVDNGAAGTSYTGWWDPSSAAGYYGTNSMYGSGGATYTWKAAVPVTGVYQVFVRWTAFSNRTTSAPYTITYSGGTKTVSYNQQQGGGQWTYAGTFKFDTSTGATVKLSAPSAYPVTYSADAVQFVYTPEVIVDNGATGSSSTGWWDVSGAGGFYGSNSLYGSGGATYTWKAATLPVTGNYDVYVWWTNFSNRSTAAPFTVYYNGGSKTVSFNQQQGGGQWQYAGTFPFTASAGGSVTLSAPSPYPVTYSADAVRFAYKP